VKTIRTDYSEHLGRDDMTPVVRQMMKEQHKSMFISLRAGELAELIVKCCGPLAAAPVASAPQLADVKPVEAIATPGLAEADALAIAAAQAAEEHGDEDDQRITPVTPAPAPAQRRRKSRRPSSDDEAAAAAVAVAHATADQITPAESRAAQRRRSSRPPSESEAPAALYAPTRPATIFEPERAEPPRSLFGDNMISEKSLDEVILSYLAEDLEEGA
jgi:hypothetical protein